MIVAAIVAGIVLAIIIGGIADRAGRRAAARVLRRWRARKAVEECPLCNGGHGREISRRRAHLFVETFEEGEGFMTGCAVAYCGRHCPGGCNRPRCRARGQTIHG